MKLSSIHTFYLILITQTFSLIGSQMTGYGIALYLFIETGDVTPLAGVTFFGQLANIIITGFAGVWADRYDRRLIMSLSDMGQAVCTALLLGAFWLDALTLGIIFGIAFVQRLFGALQTPAFMASVTLMVSDEKRDMANGLMQLSGAVSQVFALILAGVLYSIVDLGGLIIIDLLTFLMAMGVILASHIPTPPRITTPEKESMLSELSFGLRWMWRHQPIFQLALAAMFANFFLMMALILLTPYLLVLSDNNTATTGFVQGIGTMGGLIGALSIGFWQKIRPRMRVVVFSISFEGILLAIAGLVDTLPLFGLILFAIFVQFPVLNSLIMSIMQQKVPADIQGRVLATLMQMAMLIQPIGALLAGPLADNVFEPAVGTAQWDAVAWLVGNDTGAGMRLIMILNGLLMTLFVGGISIRPIVRNLESNLPDPPAMITPDAAVIT